MRKWVSAIAAVAFVAPLLGAPDVYGQAKSGKGGVYEQLNLFGEAFERIRQDAVEPVTDSKLIETAIAGMLAGLDPKSAYMNENDYKSLQKATPEDSASPGLVLTLENSQLKVVSPRDGSPAAAAGIKPGDIIFTVDKEPTYDLTLAEAEQKLRGPADSEVTLMLRRTGVNTPVEAKVKRSLAKLQTLTSQLEGGNIGYIRVAGFDDTTQQALGTAIQNLRQQAGNKLIGFIVDLRNNPGGNFDAAVAVADALIDKGDITVVKTRKTENVKRIAATPGDLANGLPIVALVNGGTAREAELVAGSLQDNRRAVLLGTKSFGESSIESVVPLNGNGAIRLTTARFMTPSGRVIQGKGLEPDLNVTALKLEKVAQADRRREADLRGALKNTDPVGPNRTQGQGNPPAGNANKPADTPSGSPSATTAPAKGESPSVATGDMGTASDEQLSEALDVLRGLALVSRPRAAR
jgi:carboxyl-terminal processing protease